MPIKIGNTNIGAIYKGSTPIAKIYKGTTLLYENASWELFSQQYLYYTLIPQTINSKSVKNKAKISKIYGNGVIENQLVQSDIPYNNSNCSLSGSGTDEITVNATGDNARYTMSLQPSAGIDVSHKVLITYFVKPSRDMSFSSYLISPAQTIKANVWNKISWLGQNNNVKVHNILFTNCQNGDVIKVRYNLTDLTLREGTGNEPTTLTDNRIQNILNRGYIPYNLGEYKGTDIGLFSSKAYNLLSGVEVGTLVSATGEETTSNDTFRTDFIGVISGGSYTFENGTFTSPTIHELDLFQYDEYKHFIKKSAISYNPNSSANKQTSISIGSSTKYIRMTFYSSGTNWNNTPLPTTLCFHLTGTRTGYAPYKSFTPITFKSQLNGAINSHDTMEITKTNVVFTKNVGSVDMGTLNWNATTYGYSTQITDAYEYGAGLAEKYTYDSNFNTNHTSGTFGFISNYLGIATSSTPSGKIIYKLATPQVITIPRKHLGIVDLGSLNWTKESYTYGGQSVYRFKAQVSGIKVVSTTNVIHNVYCAKYMTDTAGHSFQQTSDKIIALDTNSYVVVNDSDYSDATAFKSAMAGIYLFYETENEVADILDTIGIEAGGTINANWFSWVENQQTLYGDFSSSSGWYTVGSSGTISVSNNVATITKTSNNTLYLYRANADYPTLTSHKYLHIANIKLSSNGTARFTCGNAYQTQQSISANTWTKLIYIASPTTFGGFYSAIDDTNSLSVNDTLDCNLYEVIDLTLAFGSGNEPTDINDPRIQYILNKGYIPTNTTGTLKSVATEVLPNVDLSVKCK